ncbi:MAG: hypothetical protein QOK18_2828 [Mycobacterium sp.]|nr:hypothetical protein [Mycobacterium sp.]
MTLKTLVTGVAAVAVVAAAAGGVTSIASSASPAPAIQPVVFGAPLPLDSAPNLAGPLVQTLNGLAAGGSFSGPKGTYVEGGLGRIETIAADRAYSKAQAKGLFPLTFNIVDIDENGSVATANVTATANNGVSNTQPVTFVNGPSPTGWQISKDSALALLSSSS